MKNITIIVVAHNEEKYIEKCLSSLLLQEMEAYRIIVVIHNSTDKTQEIVTRMAKNHFVIEPVIYNGEVGCPYARMEALNHLTNSDQIVLCIDGDSIAASNWTYEMASKLQSNDNVLIGSLVKFSGTFLCKIYSIMHWFTTSRKNKKAIQWIWGGSFGFKIENKSDIKQFLIKSMFLKRELSLNNFMEDYIRAFYMCHGIGNIEVIRSTSTTTFIKEVSDSELIKRHKANLTDKSKLDNYFKNKSLDIYK